MDLECKLYTSCTASIYPTVEGKSHDHVNKSHDEKKPVRTLESDATKVDKKAKDCIEAVEISEEEATKKETNHVVENGVSNGILDTVDRKSHDIDSESHDQDSELQTNNIESHDSKEPPTADEEVTPEDKEDAVSERTFLAFSSDDLYHFIISITG